MFLHLLVFIVFVRREQFVPVPLDVTLLDLAFKEELGHLLGVKERLNHSVHVTRITQVDETDEGCFSLCQPGLTIDLLSRLLLKVVLL